VTGSSVEFPLFRSVLLSSLPGASQVPGPKFIPDSLIKSGLGALGSMGTRILDVCLARKVLGCDDV
jgi:hypothetical protein